MNEKTMDGQIDIAEEGDGYEDPFATFSWQEWLSMQAQTMQRFARYQRAIERRQPRLALLIALEMQAMAQEWQKEAIEWIGTSVVK